MKHVRMITDGACKGNPGRGGWACILKFQKHVKELYGFDPHTTNNRMEMTAAIAGMASLREPCKVEILTDSEYLLQGATVWSKGWKQGGWKKKGEPIKNWDLWMAIDHLQQKHDTHWTWTRGHSRDAENNRADELASRAAQEQITNAKVEIPRFELSAIYPLL